MYKNIDDKTIMEACKDSGLADFISEVSLDYVVGQNGAMLSGGQKQKIALARALVHNSPVIIFDEATSNTDVYSEHQINGLLHTKLKEKTVIIITHKQEIFKEAECIMVTVNIKNMSEEKQRVTLDRFALTSQAWTNCAMPDKYMAVNKKWNVNSIKAAQSISNQAKNGH